MLHAARIVAVRQPIEVVVSAICAQRGVDAIILRTAIGIVRV
jgi:hypothetical protein